MNIEVMDKELREWVESMVMHFHPEDCRRCKKPLRLPHNDIMVKRGWLYCSTCKEFFKRTSS